MSGQDNRVPRAIRRRDFGLEITWNADTPPARIGTRALRLACPCAQCVDEMTSRPLLDPASVPDEILIAGIELVGAYAVRIQWSDGHHAGLYTFTLLDQLGR